MRRVGYKKIQRLKNTGEKPRCYSCGAPGLFKVYFKDEIVRVAVVLCAGCLWKEYDELKVQTMLQFPIADKGGRNG